MFGKMQSVKAFLGVCWEWIESRLVKGGWTGGFISVFLATVVALYPLPPYPTAAENQHKATQAKPPAQKAKPMPVSNSSESDKTEERLKAIEEKTQQNNAAILENGRKAVDWWLSFLGVMLTGLSLMALIIPAIQQARFKKEMDQEVKGAREAKESVEKTKQEVEAALAKIQEHEKRAEALTEKIEKAYAQVAKSKPNDTEEEQAKTKNAVAILAPEREKLSFSQQLRLEAVEAQINKEYAAAADSWRLYLRKNPSDADAWLSLSYILYIQTESQSTGVKQLLNQAIDAVKESVRVNPKVDPKALINWGAYLDSFANVCLKSDQSKALVFWQKAAKKYKKASKVSKDNSEDKSFSLFNWGTALSNQANVLVKESPAEAQHLWQLAGEKYQQALAIKPDFDGALHNWGISLNHQADALAKENPEEEQRLRKLAAEKFEQAKAIESANNP